MGTLCHVHYTTDIRHFGHKKDVVEGVMDKLCEGQGGEGTTKWHIGVCNK